MNGRMTSEQARAFLCAEGAAMEPADERPDDPPVTAWYNAYQAPPQWSRPMNGRMTLPRPASLPSLIRPQWSRPMNGRMTHCGCLSPPVRYRAAMEPADERPDDPDGTGYCQPPETKPQWSRPMNGRMTGRPGRQGQRSGGAAMEPADERPDDLPLDQVRANDYNPPQWSRPMNGRMTARTGQSASLRDHRRNGAGR